MAWGDLDFDILTDVWNILLVTLAVTVIAFLIIQSGKVATVIQDYFDNLKKVDFPVKLMAVLGSGGHTGELLEVVDTLSPGFYPRIYVSTDELSMTRARNKESALGNDPDSKAEYCSILRIRNVGESFIKAIFRVPFVIFEAFYINFKYKPKLILCNGPGVCFPICLVAVILNFLHLTNARIMFIESFCRTESLSMTGRLMVYIADDFILQWNQLFEKCVKIYPKRSFAYFGRLQ